MITLPLSEFRANASSTLDLVQQGQTVRIMRHGKPVADLVPVREQAGDDPPNWKRPFAPWKRWTNVRAVWWKRLCKRAGPL